MSKGEIWPTIGAIAASAVLSAGWGFKLKAPAFFDNQVFELSLEFFWGVHPKV